ncbi:MAG: hypothetical protein ACR2GJ_01085 [Gemmatimonadaceae bacterium]
MPRILTIRLALALTALALFGLGIRNDASHLRLAGIVFLLAALVLRFAGRGTPKG